MPKLEHFRPSGLHHNPAYFHVTHRRLGARTIYISPGTRFGPIEEEVRLCPARATWPRRQTQVMQNLGLRAEGGQARARHIVKIVDL